MLGAASTIRPGAHQSLQPAQQPNPSPQQQTSSTEAAPGLDAKLQAMQQVFEMASTSTHVDHPMCLDCAAQLKDEIEAQVGMLIWIHGSAIVPVCWHVPPVQPQQLDMVTTAMQHALCTHRYKKQSEKSVVTQRQYHSLRASCRKPCQRNSSRRSSAN